MTNLTRRLASEPMTRIVALGSSNTERGAHGQGWHNWFDWLDVGLRERFGRVHHTINAGVSGETSRDMLARFDRDVALYRPHLVIITTGGNDCNPANELSLEEFGANLSELVRRVRRLDGCEALLQTYYSIDVAALTEEAERARQFAGYMQVVREVAAQDEAALVDHLARWERLRHADLAAYRCLMRDPMHLNPLGNMVFGLDLLRALGVPPVGEVATWCEPGLAVQARLDVLAAEG